MLFLFAAFFLIVPIVKAAGGDSITVSAVVPLQDLYAECIERNSWLTLGEISLYPGEQTTLTIQLQGSGNEVLRGHNLAVHFSNENGIYQSSALLSDDTGKATLQITLSGEALRKNTVQVYDLTYPEKTIELAKKAIFYVLDPFQREEKAEEEWRKSLSFGENGLLAQGTIFFSRELPQKTSFPYASARERVFEKLRAGPFVSVVV